MKRKLLALLCAVSLMAAAAGVLSGCVDMQTADSADADAPSIPNSNAGEAAEVTDDPGTAETSPDNGATDVQAKTIDYEKAFAAFAPDAVMLRTGALSITWEELFLYLYGNISDIERSTGVPPPWTAELYEDVTFAEAILEFSMENALFYKAVEYGTTEAGISLNEEDFERIQRDFEEASASYGGEEAFLDFLWETNGCRSRALFDYLVGIGLLANRYFTEYYGEEGEKLSDGDVEEYIKPYGYMMAKHILRMRPQEGEDTALAEIEAILESLEAYSGDDFGAYFDELMHEHTEDDLYTFPNGYLFVFTDMVPTFSEACGRLEPGQHSGIVESEFGYHIIYRLPIDYDEIPMSNYFQGDTSSLRRIVAMSLFEAVMGGWADSMEIETTAELDNIDLAAIFN